MDYFDVFMCADETLHDVCGFVVVMQNGLIWTTFDGGEKYGYRYGGQIFAVVHENF
jgi:hypothetical protein